VVNQGTSDKRAALVALIPVLGLIVGLIWASRTGRPMYLALAAGALLAWIAAYPFARITARADNGPLFSSALSGVTKVANVVVIVVMINILTAVWFASGTIQSLVYYGLKVVNPKHLVLAGYVLVSLVSMVLGTSVGTLSTVGIAVMGMARSLGLPLGPVAGALVSGAILGDRVSPLSAIFHLTYTMTEACQERAFKRLLETGLLAWGITFALYCGFEPRWTGFLREAPEKGVAFLSILEREVVVNPWMLLPPILVLTLASLKIPVKRCLFVGLAAGLVLALIFQGQSLRNLVKCAIWGFHSQDYPQELSKVMGGGGIAAAKNVMFLLFFAGVLSGLMEQTGMIEALASPLLKNLRSRRSLLLGAMGLSCLSAAIASNQVLAIVIPARLLNGKCRASGVEPEELGRALSDSGGTVAALFPWNLMAIISAQALQYPTASYEAYAFYLWILPVVTAIWVIIEPKGSGAARRLFPPRVAS